MRGGKMREGAKVCQPFREYLYVESFGRTTLECAAGRQPPRLSAWGLRKVRPGRTDFAQAPFYFGSAASYRPWDLKSMKIKLKTVFNFSEEYMPADYGCQ